MTYGYIYKIEFPNGKHYIGLTITSLKQRQTQHKSRAKKGSTKYLYNAIRKYEMEDTFELIEIDTADTYYELCELEISYIQMYNSYYKDDCGYNMTFGGEGPNGYFHTEENKKKQGETMKKHYKDNPEAGKEHGEKLKKYYKEPGARKKHSEKLKKYHKDNPNASKKISETTKKQFENPEARKKHSQSIKKHFESPDAIKNLLDGKGQNKPFDVFTTDGIFIKTFTYQFEAREYLQKEHHITSSIKIGAVLSGNQKTSAGFLFKYK